MCVSVRERCEEEAFSVVGVAIVKSFFLFSEGVCGWNLPAKRSWHWFEVRQREGESERTNTQTNERTPTNERSASIGSPRLISGMQANAVVCIRTPQMDATCQPPNVQW